MDIATLCNILGLIGVFISVFCYARVQWQRDFAKRLSYSVLNMCSALLIFPSLAYSFNLPYFVSNTIWLLLSFYGIYRCYKYIWRERAAAAVRQ